MRKAAKWLAAVAISVFVIAFGIMGLKILDHNYLVITEGYAALISFVLSLVCVSYIKLTNRCPHCGKTTPSFGKYCPCCGKKIA